MTNEPPITYEAIDPVIRRLAESRRTDLNFIEETLGMKFEPDPEVAGWSHSRPKLLREPYVSGLFSQKADASISRLSLTLHEDLAPVAGEAIEAKYGRPSQSSAIRAMGREGAFQGEYHLDHAKVMLTLSAQSRRLLAFTIEWPF